MYIQTQACRCQLWFGSFLILSFLGEIKLGLNVRKSAALFQ